MDERWQAGGEHGATGTRWPSRRPCSTPVIGAVSSRTGAVCCFPASLIRQVSPVSCAILVAIVACLSTSIDFDKLQRVTIAGLNGQDHNERDIASVCER